MDWRFSAFLVALISILFGFTWATGEAGICDAPHVKAVLADHGKDGALSCFDFWLNRYQTLVGAFTAIGAAWYAGMLVRRQITKSDEQLRLASQQFAAQVIPDFEKRYIELVFIKSEIDTFYNSAAEIRRQIKTAVIDFNLSEDKTYSDFIVNAYTAVRSESEKALSRIDLLESTFHSFISRSGPIVFGPNATQEVAEIAKSMPCIISDYRLVVTSLRAASNRSSTADRNHYFRQATESEEARRFFGVYPPVNTNHLDTDISTFLKSIRILRDRLETTAC